MLFHFFLLCWLLCPFFSATISSLTLFLHCSQFLSSFFFFTSFVCSSLSFEYIIRTVSFLLLRIFLRWLRVDFCFWQLLHFSPFVQVSFFSLFSIIFFFTYYWFYDVPIDNICSLYFVVSFFIYCSIFIVKIHYSQCFFFVATNLFSAGLALISIFKISAFSWPCAFVEIFFSSSIRP